MRLSWMRALACCFLVVFPLWTFAQTPLPVDSNTLALWNFDADSAANVVDSGPNGVNGIAHNTVISTLVAAPALQANRFFKDQTSFISFGNLSPNSPLDLMSLNEWSVEFVVSHNRKGTEARTIFDNGQIEIQFVDSRFSVMLKRNGMRYGVATETFLFPGNTYRVAVIYQINQLAIQVNGKTEAVMDIPATKGMKSRVYNQPIRIGGTPSEGISSYYLGRNHSCLKNDLNELKCWGNADHGQLGDLTFGTYYFMPVLAVGMKNAEKVSLGENFTCGLQAGKVRCWGKSMYFALGVSLPDFASLKAIEVPGLSNVVDIQSGRNHSCARMQDKTVKCWGNNEHGQMGNGLYYWGSFAGEPYGVSNVQKIVTGADHTCALKDDATLWCWGKNERGQIGQPSLTYPTSANPLQVTLPPVADVIVGDAHTCALLTNGSVQCWGINASGELGNGTGSDTSNPTAVVGLEEPVARLVSSNGNHTCAVDASLQNKCWGSNDRGQLNRAPTLPFSATPLVVQDSPVSNLVAGGKNTCYQRNDKALYCLGSNAFGLLGDVSTGAFSASPVVVLSTKQSHFPGYIDDIRVSNIARFTIAQPVLTLASPAQNTADIRPVFQINVATSFPLNPTSVLATLNGTVVSGLGVLGNTISGQLSSNFAIGDNVVTVTVRDSEGNLGRLKTTVVYTPSANPNSPVLVKTSFNNSCYLTQKGDLWCWGANQFGQLGIETLRFSSNAVKNPFVKNIVDFSVGEGAICALDRSNALYCWGDNFFGQLGTNEDLRSRRFPAKVDVGASPINKLIGGMNSFCVFQNDGKVKCWGGNNFNKLGLPGHRYAVPTEVPTLYQMVDGALGEVHSCFVNASRAAYCMGFNNMGQLGDGTVIARTNPVQVSGLSDVAKISIGFYSTCAMNSTGDMHCWGLNDRKQLGDSTANDFSYSTPVLVTVGNGFTSFTLGEKHVCGLRNGFGPTCWGQNSHGEMGDGSLSTQVEVFEHANLDLMQIAAGGNTICGLTQDNKVFCWGLNNVGQAGNNLGNYVSTPAEVLPHTGNSRSLTDLVSGQANACMKVDGSTHCWGNNEQEQLGFRNGNFVERYPIPLTNLENSIQTSIGYGLICHVNPATQVMCSGFNNFGQAGGYDTTRFVSPAAQVSGLNNIRQVKAGLDFACALFDVGGAVNCWGNNNDGQLGRGDGTSGYMPQPVKTILNIIKIDVAQRGTHACALQANGKVWCWGKNDAGQAYASATGPVRSPIQFATLGTDNVDISLGARFTCVLKATGKIVCFGANNVGQLGVGLRPNNNKLEPAVSDKTFTKLSAGENHVCALDTENDVYCWGGNLHGELGIGNTEVARFPTKVMGNVSEVASGAEHTCALTLNNKLACWGYNGNGQLGNGGTDSSLTPVFSSMNKK